jgi:hypothetical protein
MTSNVGRFQTKSGVASVSTTGVSSDGDRKPASHPPLGGRVTVELQAELQREAGLTGARTTDQCVDRDVHLVIDPSLKLGKKIFTPDERELAGFGDEEIQLAHWLARREPAAAIRRPKLSPPERQDDAGIAKGKRDRIAIAGH